MPSRFTSVSFITTTYGSALVGSWLLMALYGLVTSQMYKYFSSFPNDTLWKKLVVIVLWVMVTVHACVTGHVIYHYMISSMFRPLNLAKNSWALNVSIMLHVFIVGYVMLYFVHNIFWLSGKRWRWWNAGIILAAVLGHVGTGLATVANMFRTPLFEDFKNFQQSIMIPMTVTQLLADVMIATALCMLLKDKWTSFSRTQSIIRTLMIYATNRCILTSTVALVQTLAMIIDKEGMWYIGSEFTLTNLYTASLMATLNARKDLRNNERNGELMMNSIHLSGIQLHTETIVTDGTTSSGQATVRPTSVSFKSKKELDVESALKL